MTEPLVFARPVAQTEVSLAQHSAFIKTYRSPLGETDQTATVRRGGTAGPSPSIATEIYDVAPAGSGLFTEARVCAI